MSHFFPLCPNADTNREHSRSQRGLDRETRKIPAGDRAFSQCEPRKALAVGALHASFRSTSSSYSIVTNLLSPRMLRCPFVHRSVGAPRRSTRSIATAAVPWSSSASTGAVARGTCRGARHELRTCFRSTSASTPFGTYLLSRGHLQSLPVHRYRACVELEEVKTSFSWQPQKQETTRY